MRAITDLTAYKGILPYASEIFGIYQGLLGWESKRTKARFVRGFTSDQVRLSEVVRANLKGRFALELNGKGLIEKVTNFGVASLSGQTPKPTGSFVADEILAGLPQDREATPEEWDQLLDTGRVEKLLSERVAPQVMSFYHNNINLQRNGHQEQAVAERIADQFDQESTSAAYMLHLKETKQYGRLNKLLFSKTIRPELMRAFNFSNPMDMIDPNKDIQRISLSPIGIVHLFRQYFFELDTFLGTPVGHVWLSPGSQVELIEVSTRKTYVERTTEAEFETIAKSEKSLTQEDELSAAVKQDNKQDTKFGVSSTVNQGWVGGSATATGTIDLNMSQSMARETTHRRSRQQTEKLSTEIRNSFKSTFKTITETTDTSSKRYMLNNTTDELLNYEMRRKMRQVGVQVQDIGTYLCWQTYVDDPGRQLGIAQLVHLAKGPEVSTVPPPEAIPYPAGLETFLEIDIPFIQISGDKGDLDESYTDGKETDTDTNEGKVERIQRYFRSFTIAAGQAGLQFEGLRFDYLGNDVLIEAEEIDRSAEGIYKFGINLRHINFRGNSPIRIKAIAKWELAEAAKIAIDAKNDAKTVEFSEKTKFEFEKAFVTAARERIKVMSSIEPRPFNDLREEERIVVYRKLIQDMLTPDLKDPDARTHQVVAELLNTIFDIDKMLYFVAPEWWRPRLHRSGQSLGGVPGDPARREAAAVAVTSVASTRQVVGASSNVHATIAASAAEKFITSGVVKAPIARASAISSRDTAGWGGKHRPDNYYITEESTPAKLGASLGWLLQLDGDNLRNSFLNAPWVKAVIPIRPGMERAAISWLEGVGVEGSDGLDKTYAPPQGSTGNIPHAGPTVTVRDAINRLCDVVANKHRDANIPVKEIINDDNTVSATPVDKVYEHGFYPLQDGFRVSGDGGAFEVFDQWVEILPTDQVVPVPVKYDPITGRQV